MERSSLTDYAAGDRDDLPLIDLMYAPVFGEVGAPMRRAQDLAYKIAWRQLDAFSNLANNDLRGQAEARATMLLEARPRLAYDTPRIRALARTVPTVWAVRAARALVELDDDGRPPNANKPLDYAKLIVWRRMKPRPGEYTGKEKLLHEEVPAADRVDLAGRAFKRDRQNWLSSEEPRTPDPSIALSQYLRVVSPLDEVDPAVLAATTTKVLVQFSIWLGKRCELYGTRTDSDHDLPEDAIALLDVLEVATQSPATVERVFSKVAKLFSDSEMKPLRLIAAFARLNAASGADDRLGRRIRTFTMKAVDTIGALGDAWTNEQAEEVLRGQLDL